jgi:hypothetical protein
MATAIHNDTASGRVLGHQARRDNAASAASTISKNRIRTPDATSDFTEDRLILLFRHVPLGNRQARNPTALLSNDAQRIASSFLHISATSLNVRADRSIVRDGRPWRLAGAYGHP